MTSHLRHIVCQSMAAVRSKWLEAEKLTAKNLSKPSRTIRCCGKQTTVTMVNVDWFFQHGKPWVRYSKVIVLSWNFRKYVNLYGSHLNATWCISRLDEWRLTGTIFVWEVGVRCKCGQVAKCKRHFKLVWLHPVIAREQMTAIQNHTCLRNANKITSLC